MNKIKSMMFTVIIISCLALTIIGLPVEHNDQTLSESVNAELIGGGFEGDILLPPNRGSSRGAAYNGEVHRWPNKIIPYDLSSITNVNDQKMITTAMNQLMYDVGTAIPGQVGRKVCVFFRPAETNDREILKIQYGNGCSASIGYGVGYKKALNLQPNACFQQGVIQHELIHVLGFFHEQSRPDRDSYITVHQENINPNEVHNFAKYQWGIDVESQGISYDYGSLMHYPENAFSINGRPTITPNQNNVVIGQRVKLSQTDILEIRHYYKC